MVPGINNPGIRQRQVRPLTAAVGAALCLLVTLATTATVEGANRGSRKADEFVSSFLSSPLHSGRTSVIVRTVRGRAAAALATAVAVGADVRPLGTAPGLFEVRGSARQIAVIVASPAVDRVSANATVQAHGTAASADQAVTNPLIDTLGVGVRWTGRQVGVAVIDSGIERTADFSGALTFYDFTRVDDAGVALPPVASAPYDDYGHGTHVAGLIASNGKSSAGLYRGVAPGVRLIGLKVLDGTGAGLTSNVIRAIDFAVANRRRLGIDVINLSLGHPIYEPAASDPLVQAVEHAAAAGIVVVASAGNIGLAPTTGESGYAGITSPGNAPSAITVGALDTRGTVTRTDDMVAPFSSRGPSWYDGFVKPDVVAPGMRLVSNASDDALLTRQCTSSFVSTEGLTPSSSPVKASEGLIRFSGTSMAAAVVSGVVALTVEAHRTTWPGSAPLTPNAVKAILQATAIDVPGSDVLTQGAGAVNGSGAVDLAAAIDTQAPAGSSWLTTSLATGVSTIAGESYAWSSHIVWGDRIVWGDAIYQSDLAWTQRIVWGDVTVLGDRIVWGDSLVWADPSSWANRIVWGDAFLRLDTTAGERIVWGDSTAGSRPFTW